MPKNKKPKSPYYGGAIMSRHTPSNIALMRIGKNTHSSDMQETNIYAGLFSHTSPIARTTGNDGHDNPARQRHARTKAWHAGMVIVDTIMEAPSK